VTEWTGGCLCGAVRYRLASAPFDAGWCHCRTCQLNSGSPAMAFASIPMADFHLVTGADRVRKFRSSDFGWRMFCGECGTPLGMHVDYDPKLLDFSIATLDAPERLTPEFHIFYSSRIAWAPACDALPRHERERPGEKRA
jgi:hypothetical protein